MHPDPFHELADGPLTVADGIKDSQPSRFSDHLEDCDLLRHGEKNTLEHIYVQPYAYRPHLGAGWARHLSLQQSRASYEELLVIGLEIPQDG